MNEKTKNILGRYLPPILGVIIRELFKGKTKTGVYILGLSTLTLKFLGVPIEVADTNPEMIPTAAKVAVGTGTAVLGVGIVHDLIKKGKGIANGIKDVIKFF